MKFTLDTNIFLHGLCEDIACRHSLKKFLHESESFFTAKVFNELAGKKGEWALILGQLIRKWDGKTSLIDAYENLKGFFQDIDTKDELLTCKNFIEYLERKRTSTEPFNFDKERTSFLSYVGGYLASRKPIYPDPDMYKKHASDYSEIRKKINEHNLVVGEQDKKIICEIFVVTKYFSDKAQFVSRNKKDFYCSTPQWRTELGNVEVLIPEEVDGCPHI